uniref:Uncharacterized protein n=1 Tax=Oryza brachyantha TaxID=4533 RepID=J3LYL0_ORYBR
MASGCPVGGGAAFCVQASNLPVGPWSSGLCGCYDDVSCCCLTFFCPRITFGRIVEIVNQRATSCCGSGTLYVLLSMMTGFLLLPLQAAPAVRAQGEALRRLLRPLVMRALRPLPGVPRAQEAQLRHVPRMAGEHGEDGEGCCDRTTADVTRDDSLVVIVLGHPLDHHASLLPCSYVLAIVSAIFV